MMRSKIPRYLLYPAIAGTVVIVLISSVFFVQQAWLTSNLVSLSTQQHESEIRTTLEQRAASELQLIATSLTGLSGEVLRESLERLARDNNHIESLRLLDEADLLGPSSWTGTQLTLAISGPSEIRIQGLFQFENFDADAFAQELQASKQQTNAKIALVVGTGSILLVALLAGISWFIARRYAIRIHELKTQAEKLRDSNFGERLKEQRGDELGELAAVFNDMRDKLRLTTLSRDYVDSILSSMNDAIIVVGDDGTIKRINKAAVKLLGYTFDEIALTSIDLIVDTKKSGSLADEKPFGSPREAFFIAKDGNSIPVSYTCSLLGGKEAESGDRIISAQNISERRKAEKRIRYLARIDALTKVPNRMQFQHLLQRAIARANRGNRELCLFYIDVDRFKEINDTFGHLAGDTTLETVADRLTAALPGKSTIGRLAGDEFAIFIEHASPSGEGRPSLDALANSLLKILAEPFDVQGHEVFMTASMGVAFFPRDAENVIDLIRNADAALYSAKKAGGNVFAEYSPAMNEAAVERLMTKSRLKRAFERNELRVHYQPKYNMETGEVFGAEALVRWELPERGMILPSDFIPIAEESSLIIELGEWVLDKVCEDFRFWQRSVSSPGRVSVNLSLKQLRQKNFSERISAIMRSYEVSPTSLELEITETTLMENTERTVRILDELYSLGLHLSIDDFGTGYSSLSALQQFPISTLKIDRSFVRDVTHNKDAATIVSTVVQMGRNLQLDVVAEGVETEDQLAFLQTLGCNYVQGMLFGNPMNSDDYLELLLAQLEGTDSYRALFA